MHAHLLRVAPRSIVLLLAASGITWATMPIAGAQSARTTVAIPVALVTTPPNLRAARNASQCVATLTTGVAVRAATDSAGDVTEADSLDDSSTDLDAVSAGFGMVVVDSTGRIIQPDKARQASADIQAEGCCPVPKPDVVWAARSAAADATNKGNETHQRCVDAKNPPSNRSHL